MAEIWEKEYLVFMENLLRELADDGSIRSVAVTENEGKPALCMIPALPQDGYENVEFRFTVEHILEGTEQIQIMVSMYSGVPADRISEAEKIIARLNEFMILGNTAVFYQGGMIFYNHAFVIDREMDVGTVTGLLGKTMAIIMKTVPQIMEALDPVVNGTTPADALIQQGIDLIQ